MSQPPPGPTPPAQLPGLWQNPSFLRLWIAHITSGAGSAITQVALPLTAVLLLNATPTQMGLLRMAGSLANLLFGFVAGVWVDRTRRRPILVGADVGRALLLGSIPLAAWLGVLSFTHLWLVAFAAGTLSVFFQIGAFSVLPALVEKRLLVQANSSLSTSDAVVSIAGPGVGGGLVQLLGAPVAIVADAFSYILSAVALASLGDAEAQPAHSEQSVWQQVAEGIHELIRTPLLRALTVTSSLGMLAVGVSGAVQMLFFVNELGFSPAVVGFVLAVGGGGSLLGALLAGRVGRLLHVGPTLILGKLLWIVGSGLVAGAGLLGWAEGLVAGGLALSGLGGTFYFVNQASLRQVITSVQLLGRVTAARRFVLFGVSAVGALLGGLLGESIGLRGTLLVGVLALVAELALIIFSPVRLARMEG